MKNNLKSFKKLLTIFYKKFFMEIKLIRKKHTTTIPLIVSLTSFPGRFKYLDICLLSLLTQSIAPDRIILWMSKVESEQLPKKVLKLQKWGLEIKECENLRSYDKIIHLLKEESNVPIVTADDDQIYPENWLQLLYNSYRETPNQIHCHRARLISFDYKGKLNKYIYWPKVKEEMSSILIAPIGFGGVLYPPGSLNSEVMNSAVFLEKCKYADDIWLKAMSILNSTKCHIINKLVEPIVELPNAQIGDLYRNNRDQGNDIQIAAVFSDYGILDLLNI